jgi:hypothetical protein
MDSKLFRLPTKPNFYSAIGSANPFNLEQKGKNSEVPTEDSRFPGIAAPMSDGRLVTDYMNHCSKNVPTGQQYATKEWMTKNAIQLIQLSRRRFSERTGAIYGIDPQVVPPPAVVVKCETYDCFRLPRDEPGGIGMERAGAEAPELFGTWSDPALERPRPSLVPFTKKYEGGRNTPRG